MRNFYDDFSRFAARKGLYCVWVRTDGCEGSPLVARWINPRVAQNVQQAEHRNFQISVEIRLGEESSELEIDPALRLAFAGAS